MPGIPDRSMKSFLSAVQFVLMLSNNDRNLYIYALKKFTLMRDARGEGKSSNHNPNVLFVHVVQIWF